MDDSKPAQSSDRPPQTLDDWTSIYEGLSETEIEEIDKIIKTRAKLARPVRPTGDDEV